MKIEIDFKEDKPVNVQTTSLGDLGCSWTTSFDIPLTGFDVNTFWESLWVVHDLLSEVLAVLPSGEIGVTLTSPSNKSLRYAIRKV